jgi:polysaccharide export outer membrane protein
MGNMIIQIWILFLILITPAAAFADTRQAYIIGPSDVLRIDVFENPEFSGDFTVTADGFVIYPLIGPIRASGLTIDELRNVITDLLEKDYLYDPVVSVLVKAYRSKSVSVFGNYGNPGTYYIDRPLRLFDLLTQANAISPQLGKIRKGQYIRVVRKSEADRRITLKIDSWELIVEGKDDANIHLENGDLIYLPKISQIQVISGVRNPGIYPYEENMTVQKAITQAGGASQNLPLTSAVLRRIKDGKEIRMNVSMEDILQPDDILEIPVVKLEIHVIGEVSKPGAIPYEDGITVLMAITKAGGATKRASVRNTVIKRIRDNKEVRLDAKMGDIVEPGDIVEVPVSFW